MTILLIIINILFLLSFFLVICPNNIKSYKIIRLYGILLLILFLSSAMFVRYIDGRKFDNKPLNEYSEEELNKYLKYFR